MFWFILPVFFVIALGMLLIPLFRNRNEEVETKKHTQNMDVYKAQLQELDTDLKSGALSETEAASARLEIERRLLKTEENQEKTDKKHPTETSGTMLVMVTTIVLLGATGFYLNIGMPGMQDFPLKEQKHSTAALAKENKASADIITEISEIKTHLSQNPDDIKAWRALGQNQGKLKKWSEAAQAFQRWYELEPDNINAAVTYGESLIMLSDGRVGPAALLTLKRARNMQPQHPAVRHYLALAQYQSGNIEQALASWEKLAADSEAGAPWLRPLRGWIRQAQKDLGIETIENKTAAPRLSEAQQKALTEMSPSEQTEMIRGMVGRLQDKMDQNPENIEGWFRLAQAYGVLGQKGDAIKSLEMALKYAPDDLKPQIKKQLEVLMKQE